MLFQLKIVLSVVPMVKVELTVLVFVSLSGVNFDFSRPFDKILVFDFCKHLGNWSVEG